VLKLSEPVDHDPVVAPTPFVEPLMLIGAPEQWCVLLANRRTARVFCGSRERLDELDLLKDFVPGRHDQGGLSQSRYQHHTDKKVEDHLKHTAEVVFERLRPALPAGILVGAPQELVGDLESHLHPYLRERLVGRIDIDVENTTPEQVRQAAEAHIDAAAQRRVDEAVRRLLEAFAMGGRAAGGLDDVLAALLEQRVERLVVDRGFRAPGVACPTCGWLGAAAASACPIDGSAVEQREDVVEAAVERALMQSAHVIVLRDRPELASHGHIAAILRF
jgi:peptide chain release factor subunit 1